MSHYKDFLIRGKFNCIKCGACCSYIKPLADNGKFDPTWVKDDGSCIHLDKNMQCKIYHKRPDICNVDKTLKAKGYKDRDIARMCKTMKDNLYK